MQYGEVKMASAMEPECNAFNARYAAAKRPDRYHYSWIFPRGKTKGRRGGNNGPAIQQESVRPSVRPSGRVGRGHRHGTEKERKNGRPRSPTHMLFEVFQWTWNDLEQVDCVQSRTVSRQTKRAKASSEPILRPTEDAGAIVDTTTTTRWTPQVMAPKMLDGDVAAPSSHFYLGTQDTLTRVAVPACRHLTGRSRSGGGAARRTPPQPVRHASEPIGRGAGATPVRERTKLPPRRRERRRRRLFEKPSKFLARRVGRVGAR